MTAKRSRHEIEQAIKSTQPWAQVSTAFMDTDTEYLFRNRVRAVDLYADGEPLLGIKETTSINGAELHRLIKRCLSASSDGLVRGYAGLIPNARLVSYARISPLKAKLPESKGGYAGAFSNLLVRYPELEQLLVRKILKLKYEKAVYEFRIKPKHVHKLMINYLKRKDHPKDEWPYGTKLLGYRSVNQFVHKVLDHNFDRGVLVNGEAAAQAHLAVGSGKDALLTYEYMMEAAEIDSYHIDAHFSIGFENQDGLISYVSMERINIIALVDRVSTAVWWFSVVFSSEVSASDVVRLMTESLRSNLPRPERASLPIKLTEDMGFPTEIFPELAHTVPTVLMPDNALANLAGAVSETLRKNTGYTLCYGPPGHFEARPNVERTFGTLAAEIFQRLPSTTGAGPGLGRVKGGAKISADLKMDASHIEELAFNHFAISNATPSEGIGFLSPIEYIRQKMQQNNGHYLPRTVLQERIAKMAHYHITESVVVRCYPKRGIRPYVQIDRVHYSSDVMRESAWLSGKEIIIEIDEHDMRTVKAYWPDGTFMEVLTAAAKWSRTKHSRKTRKAINSLIAQKLLIVSEFDDPVILYMELLSDIAQSKVVGVPGVASSPTKAATERHRVEKEVTEGLGLEDDVFEAGEEAEDTADHHVPTSKVEKTAKKESVATKVSKKEADHDSDDLEAESSPTKTATIIPYPMPDLKKIIKGF
ncbi:hypothetical protein JOE33_000071 [Pseudomonas sp. PvP027]|jgi:hypothetical protein|uniref:hypothetical protein n=1 Tax=Pseudomonas sp. PvP027 TaxID=2806587 RepID=UPI0001E298D7|nr:hypothetical protein [Pseudomonas sp. PvP027]MBP1143148.1 hypothetical protein [Pseudomonas sp. PvP027]